MNENETCQTGSNRLSNGRFAKGFSGNPNGPPQKPEVQELYRALRIVKKKKGNKSLIIHAVERAYLNDQVLIAILKKLLPDKIEGKLEGQETKIIIINNGSNKRDEFIRKITTQPS